MKICSLIIQNKKGQNLFVVSANDFPHETSLQYSKDIYNYILSQIKAAKKIHRSIPLDSRYICVCTVTKEAIFLVIVQRQDLFLGYESIKKLSEFFAKNMKLEITTKRYQEMLLLLDEFLYTKELMPFKLQYNFIKPIIMSSRSIVDCDHLQRFSTLQAEIERNLIANIPLKYAKKRQISERIQDIVIKYAKPIELNFTQIEQDNKWVQNLKKFNYNCAFTLKSKTVQKENIYRKYQPQRQSLYQKNSNLKQSVSKNQYMSISSSDIQIMKSKFQGQLQRATGFQDMYNQYSKQAPPQPQKQLNLLGQEEQFAQVQSPKVPVQSDIQQQQPQQQQPQPQQPQQQQQSNIGQNQSASQKIQSFNDLIDLNYQPVQQRQVSDVNPNSMSIDLSFLSLSPLKQAEVHLKLLEKMILNQRDAKVKEIKMFGQITLEGEFSDDTANLQLIGDSWLESNGCQKRITPNSIDLQVINDFTYRMPIKTQIIKNPKAIIDYIIPTKSFSQNRLPLILIYKLEYQQNLSSFCLQYKVTDGWKSTLFDVDIEVVLQSDVEYEDLKTMPSANSINDKKILWKAKQLGSQQKGKLILNLLGIRKKEQQLLQYIRISLKTNTSIIEEMDCLMFYNVQEYHCVKRLSVEYKILPNT